MHSQEAPVAGRRLSILVVDDDADTCDVLAEVLKHAGHLVTTARDGEEALGFLSGSQPDMILLDIQMPTMDGPEFRQAMRRNRTLLQIPTVVMTGSTEEPVLDVGVVGVLHKPFRSDELLALVDRACGAA